MAATDEQTEKRLRLKRDFSDFLEQDHGHGQYTGDIRALVSDDLKRENNKLRLEVDLDDVRSVKATLQEELFDDPSDCIPAFEDALDDYIKNSCPKKLADMQRVRCSLGR